ncbi:MAG: ferritin family protein [Dehalococcoidia bacterium]|nr:ferritin family protein [Dehalococcoidia bacterium]
MVKQDALAVVELAIEREKGGHSFYTKAAETTQATDGRRMFNWLAQEELGHLKHLEEVRQNIIDTGKITAKKGGEGAGISTPLDKKSFPWSSEAVGEAKADTKELEALRIGIKAEKEDIAFYTKAAVESTTPEAREMYNRLVAVEKGHQELLEEEYEWLSKSKTYFTIHRFNLPK